MVRRSLARDGDYKFKSNFVTAPDIPVWDFAFDDGILGEGLSLYNENKTVEKVGDDEQYVTTFSDSAFLGRKKFAIAIYPSVALDQFGVGVSGSAGGTNNYLGITSGSIAIYQRSLNEWVVYTGDAYLDYTISSVQNRVEVAFDSVRGLVWFSGGDGYWNGSSTDDPYTGIGGIDFGGSGDLYAGVTTRFLGDKATIAN